MIVHKILKKIFGRKQLKNLNKDDYIMIYCNGKMVSLTTKSNKLRLKKNANGTATIFIAPKKQTLKERARGSRI